MKKLGQILDEVTVTFGLYGAERDEGRVRVVDLAKCLERMEECLLATERCIRSRKPSLTYLVADLRQGSAICSMSARKPRRGPDYRGDVVSTLRQTIRSFQSGDARTDPRLDRKAIESFKRLGDLLVPRSTSSERRRMVVDGTEVTSQFILSVTEALTLKDISVGSVSGKLEKIDVHGKNQFAIYPAIGSSQIVCTFSDELLTKVKDAIKKTVTVYGKASYGVGSLFPERMEVVDIEEHLPAEKIKPLSKLKGVLSGLPGESVNIVRKLRDDWQD